MWWTQKLIGAFYRGVYRISSFNSPFRLIRINWFLFFQFIKYFHWWIPFVESTIFFCRFPIECFLKNTPMWKVEVRDEGTVFNSLRVEIENSPGYGTFPRDSRILFFFHECAESNPRWVSIASTVNIKCIKGFGQHQRVCLLSEWSERGLRQLRQLVYLVSRFSAISYKECDEILDFAKYRHVGRYHCTEGIVSEAWARCKRAPRATKVSSYL